MQLLHHGEDSSAGTGGNEQSAANTIGLNQLHAIGTGFPHRKTSLPGHEIFDAAGHPIRLFSVDLQPGSLSKLGLRIWLLQRCTPVPNTQWPQTLPAGRSNGISWLCDAHRAEYLRCTRQESVSCFQVLGPVWLLRPSGASFSHLNPGSWGGSRSKFKIHLRGKMVATSAFLAPLEG